MSEEKHKYDNPDPRCTHPPCAPGDRLGYCWSYAHHVDGTDGFEDIEKICPGCEMFKETPSELDTEAKQGAGS